MKRLSILLIACVAVFGNISAQNELSAKEAAKLEQDSIIASLTNTLHGAVKNLGAQGASEYLVDEANKAIDYLAALRYQEPDDETASVVDAAPQVTPADSIAMLNDSISFMNGKMSLIKKDDIPQYEVLYIKIVNDFLKGETYMGGMTEVKNYLSQVRYNEDKEGFKVLLDQYDIWLRDIADICVRAKKDCADISTRQAWKNPRESRAYLFVNELDRCRYNNREDKDFVVPYIENIITLAKARILMYKEKQKTPMDFDDIIPAEFLPEKPKAENQSLQQTESTHTEFNLDNVNAAIQATKPNISSEVQSAESKPKSKPERFSEDAMQKVNDLLKEDKTKGTEAENPTEDEKTNASEEQ